MNAQELDDKLLELDYKNDLNNIVVKVKDIGEFGFSLNLQVARVWFNPVSMELVIETE
jgi:hypothetical protein